MARSSGPSKSSYQQGISTFLQCFKPQAAKLFTKHLEANPGHFDSLLYRGISYSITGEDKKAYEDFSSAKRSGKPCEQLVAEAHIQNLAGKHEEEVALLKKATVSYPTEPIGWHFYALSSYNPHSTITQDVVTAFQKSIELGYTLAGMDHYYLGLIMDSAGKKEDAIHHLREGLQLCPTFTNNHIQLGRVLLEDGQLNEAEVLLRRAKELNDTLPEIDELLSKLSATRLLMEKGGGGRGGGERGRGGGGRGGDGGKGGGGGEGGRGGGQGGGEGGGGRGGERGGASSSSDFLTTQEKTWNWIKKNKLKKAKHRGTRYYQIQDPSRDGSYLWVSQDTAKHAGAAFKVWEDKKSKIVFKSSYDEHFKEMTNKHESNEGKEIRKSDFDYE